MTLRGEAAVAMWWDMATEDRNEFQDWHSHEHFRERLAIPGFLRGSRWESADGGRGFFVMYELEAYATLTSEEYRARLNDPTPWSTKMMPKHRNMVRSQCRVVLSHGGGLATFMTTLRVSPRSEEDERIPGALAGVLGDLAERPGLTGAHLLRTETPPSAPTREQEIRGGDAVADWIILLSGYDLEQLEAAATTALEDVVLPTSALRGHYRLCHSFTAEDRLVDSNAHAVAQPARPLRAHAVHP